MEVVGIQRSARGRGRRLREPRALGRLPGHREARLESDDVIALDKGPAVVRLDGVRAGADPIESHDRRTLIKGDHIIALKTRFPVAWEAPKRSWLTEPTPAASR